MMNEERRREERRDMKRTVAQVAAQTVDDMEAGRYGYGYALSRVAYRIDPGGWQPERDWEAQKAIAAAAR